MKRLIRRLFKNYLMSHKQKTIVNGTVSEELPTSKGVPQVSILGPLFFSLYINDFHECSSRSKILQYSNDKQLYFSFTYYNGESTVMY